MVGNDVGWTGARLGRGVGATIGAAVWLSGVVVGAGIGFCVGGEDVGDCVGRAVGAADFFGVTIGDEVGDGLGRATGAAVGGDEHPQARSQASCASDESSPTTAQRDSGSSATQGQCFDGVPLLYHDELSTHVEVEVGTTIGLAVGLPGTTVGDGVGRATGAIVGGEEHPQAWLQASCASDESSPTTAQRDSGSSATHEQCFDGVLFLYHDELSTHVEDGTGATGSVGVALGAAEGAALGSLEGMALEGEGVGAGVNDTANFIESAIEASSSHVSAST